MRAKTESWKEQLLESLKDPEAAASYLSACLEDGKPEVFLLALRDVAEAGRHQNSVGTDPAQSRKLVPNVVGIGKPHAGQPWPASQFIGSAAGS